VDQEPVGVGHGGADQPHLVGVFDVVDPGPAHPIDELVRVDRRVVLERPFEFRPVVVFDEKREHGRLRVGVALRDDSDAHPVEASQRRDERE